MYSAREKAAILVEALPYIKKFAGRTVVIKYGGHAMGESDDDVLTDVVLLKYVGLRPVLVHGGGPEISGWLRKVGKKSDFIGGLRITDAETMEIAEMVLTGKLSQKIVSSLNRLGVRAVGLSGKDADLLVAVRKKGLVRRPDGGEELLDIGAVGEITAVNPELIEILFREGYVPVVAPVATDGRGETYNVNADHAAGMLAGAVGADKLVLLTDVEGILRDPRDPASLISVVRAGEVEELKRSGVLTGGMLPKVDCCVQALDQGVSEAHILDGRVPHAILLEIFTDSGIGTMVVP
ncbi:MAG: acetylglutamate kinase [Peptococcaceae bacterium]|nr:acetylglutamate kinase [Peptococcaceae bacterium]